MSENEDAADRVTDPTLGLAVVNADPGMKPRTIFAPDCAVFEHVPVRPQ